MGAIDAVGLVLHPRRDSEAAIDTILGWARERGVTVFGLTDEVTRIHCDAVPVDPATLAARAGLLVSLGGDGTMLRSMRLAGDVAPVLGVNLGRLGFLAEVDVDDLPWALSAIDEQRYTVEPRMAVTTVLPGGNAVTAFNDIALVRVPGRGQAAVAVELQGEDFVRYAADAVIVATSTGSTAYSFSAGGPIVSPTVEAVVVVPAAAHSAFNRALVLPADEEVTLVLLEGGGRLAVEVDGRVSGYLSAGDRVTVTARRAAARVVRLGRTTFYQRARRKLRVGGSVTLEPLTCGECPEPPGDSPAGGSSPGP